MTSNKLVYDDDPNISVGEPLLNISEKNGIDTPAEI